MYELCMAKLGEQVAQAQPTRITRTQRIVRQREEQKERVRLKKEWEEGVAKEGEKFVGVTSIDEYEQKYNTVPTRYQRYFTSPQQLRDEKQQKIDDNLGRADDRITYYKQRQIDKRKAIEVLESKSHTYTNRDIYNRRKKELYDDIDEAEYYIDYWGRAKSKYLSQGYKYGDANSWVSNQVNYRVAKQEARRDARARADAQQKVLNEAKPEDIHVITEYKDGKVQVRKTYADTGTKKWTLIAEQKPIAVKGAVESKFGKISFKETLNIGGKKVTFPSTSPIYEKGGKYYSEFSEVKVTQKALNLDTSLTLEKARYEEPPSVIGQVKPLTKQELAQRERLMWESDVEKKGWFTKNILDKTLLGEGVDYVKGIFEPKPAKVEVIKVVKPTRTGERGTAEISYEFTPDTKRNVETMIAFGLDADKLSGKIFESYEQKIKGVDAGELTQKKVDVFKAEALEEFRPQFKKLEAESQKQYEARVKKEKREKRWLIEEIPLSPVSALRKGYYWSQDTAPKIEKFALGKGVPEDILTEDYTKQRSYKEYKMLTDLGVPKSVALTKSKAGIMSAGVIEGTYDAIRKDNIALGYKAGLWAGGTAVVTLVGAKAVPVLAGAGIVMPKAVSTGLKFGLVGLYGGTVAFRSLTQPSYYKKGYKLGQITAKEIAPMYAGVFAGVKIAEGSLAGYERLRIWREGHAFRSPYKITGMDVLRGEKSFPTAPVGKHVKIFKAQKHALPTEIRKLKLRQDISGIVRQAKKTKGGLYVYKDASGYHATASGRFADVSKAGKGTSELPALYISEQGSIHFLGRGAEYGVVGSDWIPKVKQPFMARIQTAGFKKIPKSFKGVYTKAELQKMLGKDFKVKAGWTRETEFFVSKAQKGYSYVPARKSEIEALLRFDTSLQKQILAKSYYTRVAKPEFYKKLEEIKRLGRTEYVRRVQKFKVTRPSTYIDKILGKQAGQFKTLKVGKVVAIEKYKALTSAQEKQMFSGLLKDQIIQKTQKSARVQNIKNVLEASSSSLQPPKYYASFPSTYALQLYLLSSSRKRKRSYKSSFSYSKVSSSLGSSSSLSSSASSLGSSLASSSASSGSSASSSASSSALSGSSSGGSSGGSSYYDWTSYTPPPKPFIIGLRGKKKERKKKLTNLIYGKAYIPDFTSRIVGLDAVKVDTQQAEKLLKRVQTGIEVRRGVKLKK